MGRMLGLDSRVGLLLGRVNFDSLLFLWLLPSGFYFFFAVFVVIIIHDGLPQRTLPPLSDP